MLEEFTEDDRQAVRDQLGREPRGVAGVAWRCGCGKPAVIATEPRLPNGTPFPTTYYPCSLPHRHPRVLRTDGPDDRTTW